MDFEFSIKLVMKRVAKTIDLMDAVAKLNDPQCELCYCVHVLVFPSCIFLCAHVLLGYLSVLRFLLMRHFALLWSVLLLPLGLVLVIGNGDSPLYLLLLGGLVCMLQVMSYNMLS